MMVVKRTGSTLHQRPRMHHFQQDISIVRSNEKAALPELAGGSPRKEEVPEEVRGYFLDICAPIPYHFPQSSQQFQAGSGELPGMICLKIWFEIQSGPHHTSSLTSMVHSPQCAMAHPPQSPTLCPPNNSLLPALYSSLGRLSSPPLWAWIQLDRSLFCPCKVQGPLSCWLCTGPGRQGPHHTPQHGLCPAQRLVPRGSFEWMKLISLRCLLKLLFFL